MVDVYRGAPGEKIGVPDWGKGPEIRYTTLSINSPGGLANWNPVQSVEISYHSPFTGKEEVMRTIIGGDYGPTKVEIISGSINEGHYASEITVTVLDNQIVPNFFARPLKSGLAGKVVRLYKNVNLAIDGIGASTRVYVTVHDSKALSLPLNADYVPGHLEKLGFDPKNPPVGFDGVFDANGNLIGFSQSSINECFLAGTPISMWDGTEKPIEQVKPGDIVVSYDEDGNLVPGRVSRTKTNRVKHILDVFGLMVTPGHATLCGDGKFEGRHVPMIDILRSDGALVLEDGSKKRAGTNFPVGSLEDRFVHAIVTEDVPGTDNVRVVETGRIRLGTRFMHPTGADITVLEIIRRAGGSLTDDGYVVLPDGVTKTPFVWTFTNRLPKPEDFVLQRSQMTLADIYEADEWEAVAPQVPPPYKGALSQSSCQLS